MDDNDHTDQGGLADLEAVTFGLGLAEAAPAELRLEYRAALDDDSGKDRLQAQLVAGF